MKIQIMNIYKESFTNILSHKGEWAKIFSGPLVLWALGFAWLLIAFLSALDSLTLEEILKFLEGDSNALLIPRLFYELMTGIAQLLLVINGLRFIFLKEGGDRWFAFNFNVRVVMLFFYFLLLGVLAALYIVISAGVIFGAHTLLDNIFVDTILGLVAFIGFIYLACRIALFQIPVALDLKNPIKTSWTLMAGNVLRLIGLTILIGLTLLALVIVGIVILGLFNTLLFLIFKPLGAISLVLWLPFLVIFVCFYMAVYLKATSLVYQGLSGK